MNTQTDKINFLRSIEKEEDIHELLSEILPKMGYGNVTVTHERGNRSENGKDLVCSQHDTIEKKNDWTAFVVKKGVVAGKSAVIQDIISQTKDCFDYEYKNVIKGLRFRVSKVKIVTNRHFSSEAKNKIETNNNFERANIAFWDEEKLVQLIDDYYPSFWYRGSRAYNEYVERFDSRNRSENISKTLGISNKKIQRIIDCAIEPKIIERVDTKDGSFEWKDRSVNTVVNIPDNSIIIGEPGSGKSTLFKLLSREIIQQNSLRNNVDFYPVVITFTNLKEAGFNLKDALNVYFTSDWIKDLKINHNEIAVRNSCVIFIDALDELPENADKEEALKSINSFHAEYPDIKIVCSSRPSDYVFYNSSNLGFKYLEINPLNKRQVEAFLSTYFADNLIKSKRLLKSLKDTAILEKLPKTPLTIALITILFDENEVEIPATITDLYHHFVDLLLGKDQPKSTLDIIETGIKHRILCHLAKELHSNNGQTITIQKFENLLGAYAKSRGQTFDVKSLVKQLTVGSGLLFINEKDEIQFKHLSFQEYFTAYEIFHHRQSEANIFVDDFNNLWWQNVAIFYAGMSKDAPLLLDDIIRKSVPKSFNEYLVNTLGMGRLVQALYNTQIDKRIAAVQRGLDNTANAVSFLTNTEDEQYKIFRNFSKYGLMLMMTGIFQLSYWSITLVEPMKELFKNLFAGIMDKRTDLEQDEYEYKLLLLISIISSEDFIQFEELRLFIENTSSKDLSLLALTDTLTKGLQKQIDESDESDENYLKAVKKMKKRLHLIGDIADKVNIPIARKHKFLGLNKDAKKGE